MLLTNASVDHLNGAVEMYLNYLNRWEVEDYFRFLKQCFAMELMQLMKLRKLQSFLRLLMVLSDFVLREYHKGIDPLGGGLYEIIRAGYVHSAETLKESPYIVSKAIADVIHEEQRIPILQKPLFYRRLRKSFYPSPDQMTMELATFAEP